MRKGIPNLFAYPNGPDQKINDSLKKKRAGCLRCDGRQTGKSIQSRIAPGPTSIATLPAAQVPQSPAECQFRGTLCSTDSYARGRIASCTPPDSAFRHPNFYADYIYLFAISSATQNGGKWCESARKYRDTCDFRRTNPAPLNSAYADAKRPTAASNSRCIDVRKSSREPASFRILFVGYDPLM